MGYPCQRKSARKPLRKLPRLLPYNKVVAALKRVGFIRTAKGEVAP